MNSLKPLVLATLGLLLVAPVHAQSITGISSAQAKDVEVLSVSQSQADKDQRKAVRLQEAAAPGFAGAAPKATRVGLTYEPNGADPIEVKGVVYDVGVVRVERYRIEDMEEAIALADHDRDASDELRIMEVRGNELLVISGDAAADKDLVQRVRAKAWPRSRSKTPTRYLSVQQGLDLIAVWVDEEALALPDVAAIFESSHGMLLSVGSMDPNATVIESGPRSASVEGDFMVAEVSVDATGGRMIMSDSRVDFDTLTGAIDALVAKNPTTTPAAQPSAGNAPGAAGRLTGVMGH